MGRGRGRPARVRALPLVGVVTALGATALLGGCATASAPSGQARGTARHHGLAVQIGARAEARAGTVQVVVRAEADHAPGALAYAVRFGDGTGAHDRVPQFCVAGPGPRRQATWYFTHRYARAGTYRLWVRVGANCTSGGPVTASVRVHAG